MLLLALAQPLSGSGVPPLSGTKATAVTWSRFCPSIASGVSTLVEPEVGESRVALTAAEVEVLVVLELLEPVPVVVPLVVAAVVPALERRLLLLELQPRAVASRAQPRAKNRWSVTR